MRLTVAELKTACDWPAVLNLATTDSRWLIKLNECLERFVHLALWDRCVQRYQMCVNSACITLPRQFIGIEVIDICDTPFTIRNQWFEFLEQGPGRATSSNCGGYQVHDRGRGFVMFDDPKVASKIRLYPQNASDIGKQVTIRGFTSSGQQVLTNSGNTVGEVITLAMPYVDSTTTWMRQVFREVIKAKTKGHVLAYSYDASLPVPPASPGVNDTPLTALADWEPTETLPDYRRVLIPSLSGCTTAGCGCGDSEDGCDKKTVTVMAKLTHIPVESDLDFLPISNVGALKLGMLSIVLEDRLDWAGSRAAMHGTFDPYLRKYQGGAVQALEDEMASFQGAGTVAPIRVESSSALGAETSNMI